MRMDHSSVLGLRKPRPFWSRHRLPARLAPALEALVQSLAETDARRRARNLAALLDLGFECAEQPLPTESERLAGGLCRLTKSVPAMGTIVAVTAVSESESLAEDALGEVFREMDLGIGLFNRYETGTALGVLNDDSRLRDAPDDLLLLLGRARALHLLSNGAFDITVTPVVDALRDHRDAGLPGLPDDALLRAAAARIDAQGVVVNGRDVELREGVQVTLDGIAKGHIVDRMAAVLTARPLTGFLINAGGDIRTDGTRDGTEPWQIGVRDPDHADAELAVVPRHAGALATSGSYEIFFDAERTRHHIVNGTGVSPGACRSVTVSAPTAMLADALATAAFVAGPEAAPALVESVPGCACLLVDASGRQISSTHWRPGDGRAGAS